MTEFEAASLYWTKAYTIITLALAIIALLTPVMANWLKKNNEIKKDKLMVRKLGNSLYKDLLKMQECDKSSNRFYSDAFKIWDRNFFYFARFLDCKTYILLDSVCKIFIINQENSNSSIEVDWVTACNNDKDILNRLAEGISRLENQYNLNS
jgi:hypothetical protein